MKLIATTDLIGDLVRLYPNCQKSRTKFEEVREEQVWGNEVRRGLRNGTLPFRIGNGSEIRLPGSNEGQTAFAKHIDAEFINGYVDAHDVFEWLKGFRNDADAFAAEYGVDDATLPVASKQTAPQAAPAQQAGTEPALVVAATVVKAKKVRRVDSVLPYLQTVFRSGKFKTTEDYIRELIKQSSKTDSPFKESSRSDDAFFLKDGGKSISHSIIEDNMKRIR